MTAHDLRRRLPFCFACLLFISVFGCDGSPVVVRSPIEKPIQFLADDAIQASNQVLRQGATVLIGETHGTWETPILAASLVRLALRKGVETILCVELSSSEQAAIEEFLISDGGDAAIDALLTSPHWTNQDGRASVGMFAMLELTRRLRSEGKDIRVIAMDSDWAPGLESPAVLSPEELKRLEEWANGRDQQMAKCIVRARKKSPDAIVIALAGNVHTNVKKGAPWDPSYIPMGWYVLNDVPDVVSLNTETAGGQAWIHTDRGVGVTPIHGEDRGDNPFIELSGKTDSGYHGILYVGRITAAQPAVAQAGG